MDLVEMHERALDQAVSVVSAVRNDQLTLRTPCGEWNVADVIGHMVAGAHRAAGLPGGTVEAGNLVEEYRQAAEAAKQAWRQPEAMQRTYEMPFGTLPAPAFLQLRMVDTLTHTWDVTRATGQQVDFDRDLAQAGLEGARSSLPAERPPGMPFAPPVEVSEQLPAIDRLAAYLGRQP